VRGGFIDQCMDSERRDQRNQRRVSPADNRRGSPRRGSLRKNSPQRRVGGTSPRKSQFSSFNNLGYPFDARGQYYEQPSMYPLSHSHSLFHTSIPSVSHTTLTLSLPQLATFSSHLRTAKCSYFVLKYNRDLFEAARAAHYAQCISSLLFI
jgi:hypothetical protein